MTRTKTLTGLVLLSLLGFASPLAAQSTAPVRYFYDDLGRLTKVVDPSGNVATYNYDAVGNLLSIARSTLSSLNARAIFGFTPQRGGIGESPANTQRATPFLKLDLDPPSGEITCLGFSAKRNIFLAGALNSWVYFWTADDWHKVLALRPEAPPKAKAGKHQPEYRELTACAISPDAWASPWAQGTRLASSLSYPGTSWRRCGRRRTHSLIALMGSGLQRGTELWWRCGIQALGSASRSSILI